MTVRPVRRRKSARPAQVATARRAPADERSSGDPKSRGLNTLFLLLAVVGSLHALTMLGVETWRSAVGTQEVARLQKDIGALQFEIDGLQGVVDHTADDTYREQLARCVGFIYPDETRYVTLLEPGQEPTLSGPLCQ